MAKNPDKKPGAPPGSGHAMRDEQALAHLLAELPTGAQYVVVRRQSETDATKWYQLPKMPTSDFSIDAVMEQFGGGNYRVLVIGEKGKLMTTQMEFAIDPRIKPTKGPLAQGTAPVAVAGGEGSSLSRIEKLLEMNLMLQMKGVGSGNGDATKTGLEIAKLIVDQRPAAGGIGAESLFEKFLAGMEMGKKMGGAAEDGFAELAKGASPLFAAIAENLTATAETKRRRAEMKAIPGGKTQTTTGDWRDRVRPHVPKLIALAEAQKDPELYGELVLDNLPDEAYGELQHEAKGCATAGAFVEKVLAAFPELEPHKVWMTEFLTFLHGELVAESGAAAAP